MIEALVSLVSKIAAGLSGRGIDWVVARFKRPSIQLKRAPENLFHHILPGTSLSRVREVLGAPHRVDGEFHSFTFTDAHVQIGSPDGLSVQWIGVVLPELTSRAQFDLGVFPLILGKSTLADALGLMPDDEPGIRRDSSSKHSCFWIERYYGFTGLYRHYLFGVMGAPNANPPEFKWDYANERLESDPATVRFNWMAVSGVEGGARGFNFWAFM